MKGLVIICLFLVTNEGFAQSIVYKDVSEISKTEFQKRLQSPNLLYKLSGQKGLRGRILIKTLKKNIVLKDDGEMKEYIYSGDLKGTYLALIHELEPNTEVYYLINRQTGTIDTLIGNP